MLRMEGRGQLHLKVSLIHVEYYDSYRSVLLVLALSIKTFSYGILCTEGSHKWF